MVKVLFQPLYALGIKMVGRLVQQQYIGLLQQQAAQCHAAALTTGQHTCLLVLGRTAQGIHGLLQTVVYVPGIGGIDHILQFGLAGHQGVHLVLVLIVFRQLELMVYLIVLLKGVINLLHALHDHLLDCLVGVQLRLLRQIAHAVSGTEHHLTLITLFNACNYLEQCGFT